MSIEEQEAQNSDNAVILALQNLSIKEKDNNEIKQNLARLHINHKIAKDAFNIATVKAQMAQREAEIARNKEKVCRATLKEAQDLLDSDELKVARLNLKEALGASNKAWDRVPSQILRDRKIEKAAKDALRTS
jgi:hypothetical protein